MSLPLAIPDLRRSIMIEGLKCLPADKRLNALRALDEAMPDVAKSTRYAGGFEFSFGTTTTLWRDDDFLRAH